MKQEQLSRLLESLPEEGLEFVNIEDLDFSTTKFIDFLSSAPRLQSTYSDVYKNFKKLLIAKYAMHFELHNSLKEILGIEINFPYVSLGNISSRHFFGIDELLIYNFYKQNKSRYSNVCDIGANCGLHSKILCSLGYKVDSYEPDTTHASFFRKFLDGNINNNFYQKAVSSYSGKATFTRILNNSTGSYINDKKTSYGPTETYEVDVVDAGTLPNKYDLIKMDIEGSEADVLLSLTPSTYSNTDIIAEISTEKTRSLVWDLFSQNKVPIYAQKIGWGQVKNINDLPTSHKQGSIFISANNSWN